MMVQKELLLIKLKFMCVRSVIIKLVFFTKYLKHLRYIHQAERGFSLTCGVDGCQKKYTVVESLVWHLKRNHNEQSNALGLGLNHADNEGLINVHEGLMGDGEDDLAAEAPVHVQEQDDSEDDSDEEYDYTKAISLFILHLREQKKVPADACSAIVKEIDELFKVQSTELKTKLHKVLQRNNIDPQNIDGLDDILSSYHNVSDACSVLGSQNKQNKYFAEKFDYVEPEKVTLGYDDNGKEESFLYIPIKKLLHALLKHEDILAEVTNGHKSQDGKMRDFCDGQAFEQNELFSSEMNALQIILYYDDFQTVNPLGTRIKKNKIGAFYFSLGNIAPQFRSRLELIQLLILCHSELVKKYGVSRVVQILVDDIKSLEQEGLDIVIDGMNYNFRGTISCIVTDNLAAHTLSGFMESFSALHSCRCCLITRDARQVTFSDSDCTLRTKETHARHVAAVGQHPRLASTYGLKGDSPFNSLAYFHSIWGCPSDLAHDLFEGFACMVLEQIVRYFVDNHFFTLQQLNHKIRTFSYAPCDRPNKPSPFADELANFKIKQTASQCWCFLRLLPLFVYEWVPTDDACLYLLVDLLDIVDLICAPVISPGEVHFLNDLICHFMEGYFSTFEEASVTPKAHFLTHYARQIMHFGPLIHSGFTLRFESKHNYFKELAHRTKNRKNLCKSLAERHQYQQCLYHSCKCFLQGNEALQTINGRLYPVRLLKNAVQYLLSPLLGGNENVYQATTVTVNGTKYPTSCCVVHGFDDDEYQFGRVSCIFVIGGMEYLLLDTLTTQKFNREVHGYIVSETREVKLCRVSDLQDYHPLGLYTLPNGELVIILKYAVAT